MRIAVPLVQRTYCSFKTHRKHVKTVAYLLEAYAYAELSPRSTVELARYHDEDATHLVILYRNRTILVQGPAYQRGVSLLRSHFHVMEEAG